MAELVNDLLRPLSAPCRISWIGPACDEANYRSWRRVAVGLRQTMLVGEWSRASTELYARDLLWLKKWIDPSRAESPVTTGIDMNAALKESDPIVPETERFPRDLKWYQGEYQGESQWTYKRQTDALVAYIKTGKQIYDEAVRAGVITQKATELEQAEISKPGPRDYKQWLIRGGIVLGVLGFGVWAFTSVARVFRNRREQ